MPIEHAHHCVRRFVEQSAPEAMPLDLFAGIAATDYAVALEWYGRLFGSSPRPERPASPTKGTGDSQPVFLVADQQAIGVLPIHHRHRGADCWRWGGPGGAAAGGRTGSARLQVLPAGQGGFGGRHSHEPRCQDGEPALQNGPWL